MGWFSTHDNPSFLLSRREEERPEKDPKQTLRDDTRHANNSRAIWLFVALSKCNRLAAGEGRGRSISLSRTDSLIPHLSTHVVEKKKEYS